MPKDTTVPYFHAPAVEGGLGVLLHEHLVSLMRAKHLSRLDMSPDPVIAAVLSTVLASASQAVQFAR